MKGIILQLIFALSILLTGCAAEEGCPDTNCSDYATQAEAQAAYNANPNCHGDLDHDSDGIACERNSNGSGGTGCPNTANCGCSGKNKSDCGGSCCQWITGNGCRFR